MEVLVYGVEVGVFLCGGVWFFWWFHPRGLRLGFLVGLGLRHRLLRFWVFRWVFPMGLSVGLGVRHRLLWFWVFGWPRGVCMVRKWKWYALTKRTSRKNQKPLKTQTPNSTLKVPAPLNPKALHPTP